MTTSGVPAGASAGQPPTLHTGRLTLRPFELGDAADVQRLAGAREIAAPTLNIRHPYLDGMAEQWIASHQPAYAAGTLANFAMVDPHVGLVGAIGLRIEPLHHRAELGYWVGVPHWGHGYATEAAREVIRYGFEELGLNRIHACHVTWNPASGCVLAKVGMRHEGRLRQHTCKDGTFEDLEYYGVLAGDR